MPYLDDNGPGYRRVETSRAAAQAMAHKVKPIRARVLDFLRSATQPVTSEQIAEGLGLPYESVQPRLAELRNDGKAFDSGVRRMSRFAKPIIAWSSQAPKES